jgi:hypothetical protein
VNLQPGILFLFSCGAVYWTAGVLTVDRELFLRCPDKTSGDITSGGIKRPETKRLAA